MKKVIFLSLVSFFLLQCSKNSNQNLPFWATSKKYHWDQVDANQTIPENLFQFLPSSVFIYAMKANYPFLEWITVYPGLYHYHTSNRINSLKLGACLADMSYLAVFRRTEQIRNYQIAADSLTFAIFGNYQLPELNLSANLSNPDTALLWISAQFASIPLKSKILKIKEPIQELVLTGAWIESLYITSISASYKDSVDLFLDLARQKEPLELFADHLKEKSFTQQFGNQLSFLSTQLNVTQVVNVWDSLDNRFVPTIFPMKEPVLNLHKTLAELRKVWFQEN